MASGVTTPVFGKAEWLDLGSGGGSRYGLPLLCSGSVELKRFGEAYCRFVEGQSGVAGPEVQRVPLSAAGRFAAAEYVCVEVHREGSRLVGR